MPLLGNPWNGLTDVGDAAAGPDVAAWLDAVRAVVNGLDNANIAAGGGINDTKLDFGHLRHHQGSATPQKYLTGTKTSAALVLGTGTTAVSFTLDADVDGPAGTAFSSAPRVFLSVLSSSGTKTWTVALNAAPGTTGFTARITCSDLTDTSQVTFYWIAVGAA